TGVAAGSEDTDAVNVAQLKEVANMVGSSGGGTAFSPITVSGNTGNFTVGSAGKLNIQGDNTTITTEAKGDTVTIGLSKTLTDKVNGAIATVGTLNDTVTNLGTTVTGLQTELDKKADKTTVDNLQTELGKKAEQSAVDNLQTELGKKADKTTVDSLQTELGKKADKTTVDSLQTELGKKAEQSAVDSLQTELGKKAEQSAVDDLKDKKADKSWVTEQLVGLGSGGTISLDGYATETYAENQANAAKKAANDYTDSEVDKAKKYADNAANTAETNAKGYTDSKLGDYSTTTDMNKAIDTAKADANKYADNAANKAKTDAVADANAYTDSEVAKAKTYADNAANQPKTDAVADANAYTDTALTDNATQTWVNNQKFAKEQAVTDLDDRVSKLVVASGGYEHITVAGENGEFNVANRETAKFVGDGKNITTDATGGEVKISLANDIAVNSVNAGGTVVNQNGVALPSGVALTNNGLNNGGQVISNVAPGVRPTDAVNVSQLNNAMALSEGRLNARIDRVEKRANAGTAAAMK
ncbi:MAG: hypothetical protein J6W29_10350, partial [Neisseriaceae bacterium]|nr:hypothetical protein [Neisseriaceae bacterium]